jgi:TRAP-type mannitol/chloroaromatic compound transport system permease small subunit
VKILEPILVAVEKVNDFFSKILWVGVLLTFVIILFEVIMRYFFNRPNVWTNELSQYVFAAYAVLCGGYLMRTRKHVNVEILYNRFSPKAKIIANIVTFPVFLMFTGAMLLLGISFAWDSMSRFEHSQSAWNPPVFPVKILLPIGAFLLLTQGIVNLIRDIQELRSSEKEAAEESEERTGEENGN